MALPPLTLLLSLFFTLSFLISSSSSQTCSSYTFSSNQSFSSCADLPHLDASLHWTRSQSSAICIAFRAPQASGGWVAWGVNPAGKPAMVGTQALVAHRGPDGAMAAYPTVLTSYSPSMRPGNLSFPVYDVSAEYVGGDMIIFATLGLLGAGGGRRECRVQPRLAEGEQRREWRPCRSFYFRGERSVHGERGVPLKHCC
ncbi:cytochrome b561 and DOMON domain-containing protein-like [Iris pallida]|uniref:Cytochrome b561 and DOMON domain-containing protein-like n=1 Tax=Iris pallida TaxID=29817 RepID=A0AAX6FTH6_IRIPA|nr:cytochrome b561 and DOMON domain-containing protein-like [Iris pallida]